MIKENDLIGKYDVPAPRYTSYPTVPYWEDNPTSGQWIDFVRKSLSKEDSSYAVYLHIPFCETLCSFCGCNTSISRNHAIENPYVADLLMEFEHYRNHIPDIDKRKIKEMHFGGGSPTFLNSANLGRVVEGILKNAIVDDNPEFSIEVDPRRAKEDQLKVLYEFGFKRISLGIQDFDPEVQRLINRNQTLEDARRVNDLARNIGYDSVNFDLVYGLPSQTIRSIKSTIIKTITLKPDRIALYSYAHVPWIKGAQRLFTEDDLPSGLEKRQLYELSRSLLLEAGYMEIGMDHFALETDPLWQASKNGDLHRNFMGYTSRRTDLLLGLGCSSISDSWDCFHQNNKVTKKYQKEIRETGQATFRGHKLSKKDLEIRGYILDISCRLKTRLPDDVLVDTKDYLHEMIEDGLVEFQKNQMIVTRQGRAFLRNICMGLDIRMRQNKPQTRVFSQAV